MPRKVNLVGFTELLGHAQDIGYDWNKAHDILVGDEIPPMYEIHAREFYVNELDECYEGDSLKILKTFCEKHNLSEFTLVDE